MKYLFILLSGLAAYIAHAQEAPHHFLVEDGHAVWRTRLDSSTVPVDWLAKLKEKGVFEDVHEQPGRISGTLRYTTPLYKEAGYQWIEAPIFLLRHRVSGYATVELENGFYTITIRKIVFTLPSGGKVQTLEKVNVKKNGNFKNGFRYYDGRILHVTFSKLFGVSYN
jgi:hypothetical protein